MFACSVFKVDVSQEIHYNVVAKYLQRSIVL